MGLPRLFLVLLCGWYACRSSTGLVGPLQCGGSPHPVPSATSREQMSRSFCLQPLLSSFSACGCLNCGILSLVASGLDSGRTPGLLFFPVVLVMRRTPSATDARVLLSGCPAQLDGCAWSAGNVETTAAQPTMLVSLRSGSVQMLAVASKRFM